MSTATKLQIQTETQTNEEGAVYIQVNLLNNDKIISQNAIPFKDANHAKTKFNEVQNKLETVSHLFH